MNLRAIIAATGFVLLSGLSQASAGLLTYTFSGTVASEADAQNLFGGVDYTGRAFTVAQTFDLGIKPLQTGSGLSNASGGPNYDGSPVFGYSVLKLGSISFAISGQYYSTISINQNNGEIATQVVQQDDSNGLVTQEFSATSLGILDGITSETLSGSGFSSGGNYTNNLFSVGLLFNSR